MNLIVIKHIVPYLVWTDRVNLNMCLPTSERVYNKLSRVDLLRHDFRCIISTIKARLHLIEDTHNNAAKRGFLCKELFVMLVRPRYKRFIMVNYNFKLAVIAKLNEFTNGTKLHKETTISKEEAMEVARVARTVKKILLEKRSQELIDTQFIHNTHEDWQIIT